MVLERSLVTELQNLIFCPSTIYLDSVMHCISQLSVSLMIFSMQLSHVKKAYCVQEWELSLLSGASPCRLEFTTFRYCSKYINTEMISASIGVTENHDNCNKSFFKQTWGLMAIHANTEIQNYRTSLDKSRRTNPKTQNQVRTLWPNRPVCAISKSETLPTVLKNLFCVSFCSFAIFFLFFFSFLLAYPLSFCLYLISVF